MASIPHNKVWESEFDNIVSKKQKVPDLNNNQLKVEVHDSYKKDKKTTLFEPTDDSDVINKVFLDKTSKVDGHFPLLEKDYNEFELNYDKQSVEDFLIERAVKATIRILYDKGILDSYNYADEVLQDFLFTTRRRPDLDIVNDVIQGFCS